MLNTAEGGLLIEERRRRICEFLRAEGRVTVDALATRFGISQVTIRADLSALESAGALIRTHGGALLRRRRMSRWGSSSSSITREK
jgi:DeoR family transcriptional regulator of aga operon